MFDYEDYKGKFNILIDSENGFIDEDNAFEYVFSNLTTARYYGVPIYYGSNKKINEVVEKLHKIYNEFYNIDEE